MADRRESALTDAQLAQSALKVLQSMAARWEGLTVFVDSPWVPMDNNIAERDLRGQWWDARIFMVRAPSGQAAIFSLKMDQSLDDFSPRS